MAGVASAGHMATTMADLILNANRSVWLRLTNRTKLKLLNPVWYGRKGRIHESMPYCIEPEATEEFLFRKAYWGVRGAEGVLVYQIEDRRDSNLSIFYSNPYIGSNKFFLRLSQETIVNDELCKAMLKDAWESSGQVKWHTIEKESIKAEDNDKMIFKASGYCCQSDSACLYVTLSGEKVTTEKITVGGIEAITVL